MILTFRPIKVWPDGWQNPHRKRAANPFKSKYQATLHLLDAELRHLAATDVTLQVAASERDMRLDGQLRADAKVTHPGVIVTIDTKKLGDAGVPMRRVRVAVARRRPVVAGEPARHRARPRSVAEGRTVRDRRAGSAVRRVPRELAAVRSSSAGGT